ncbi:MAG: DUF2922 domain-containing protein [Defluviitaleaceae bacterium]|nr:DUF2922 domain-containing protein [Defluviitaleaceae bacterium]
MAITINNRAVLKFRSNIGEIVRFTIPRACVDKDGVSAQASMEAMISGGALVIGSAIPTAIYGAQIVKTERTQVI